MLGGVQLITILVAVIKSKFIALLLGPEGIGISGLLTSTISVIGGLTYFGLGTSAVKNVAAANSIGDINKISVIILVIRRLVWITGLLGLLVTLICAPLLSQLTFGNSEYTVSFMWVSCSLLFAQLSTGENVLLQGMSKLTYLAKANLIGSILGLLITIPLFYLFGVRGVVPSIILTSIITLFSARFFSRKIEIPKMQISMSRTITEGQDMLKMGFVISFSGFMVLGASYLVQVFITRYGGVDDLGLYLAGFAIINTYVGLIFSAMGTDYYPRLSAVSSDDSLCRELINKQSEIMILILSPAIIFFLVLIQWVIIILYSDKFLAIEAMIHWAALGMFFKAASWSIAYIFLAKGNKKIFFWSDMLSNSYILILNLLGYYFGGLDGMGISFMVGYLLYFLQVFYIARKEYNFSYEKIFVRIFFIQLFLSASTFCVIKYINKPYSILICLIFISLSVCFSLVELDKRIGLLSMLKKKIKI